MLRLAQRPGFHTSEFLIGLLTVLWYVVNAAEDYYSTTHAIGLSAPAIAYIFSRGLAKYEARPTLPVQRPPAPPPAPPAA